MRSNKVCPYRTQTIIYHNDRKNYMVPSHGINKMINYDVTNVIFKPCLEEKCMFFDYKLRSCTINKIVSDNK